jgi:hypothetical protein
MVFVVNDIPHCAKAKRAHQPGGNHIGRLIAMEQVETVVSRHEGFGINDPQILALPVRSRWRKKCPHWPANQMIIVPQRDYRYIQFTKRQKYGTILCYR